MLKFDNLHAAPTSLQGKPEEWWSRAIEMYSALHDGKHKNLAVTPWFRPAATYAAVIDMGAAIDIMYFWEANPTLADLLLPEDPC